MRKILAVIIIVGLGFIDVGANTCAQKDRLWVAFHEFGFWMGIASVAVDADDERGYEMLFDTTTELSKFAPYNKTPYNQVAFGKKVAQRLKAAFAKRGLRIDNADDFDAEFDRVKYSLDRALADCAAKRGEK